MKPVLDFACKHPNVDTSRLAVYGISNGGYFVPRTAVYDKRIKAVVVSSGDYRQLQDVQGNAVCHGHGGGN